MKGLSNKNVIYILLILVFAVTAAYFSKLLVEGNNTYIDKFKKRTKDMRSCPGTASYFINWQETYNTFTIPTIISTVVGIVTIVFLYSMTSISPKMTLEDSSIPILFYTIFVVWVTNYKISNCILARLCYGGCSSPYFASPSPS